MRIAIVGAGFTGLTAGLRLSQKGHQVTLFEKEKNLGGLAASFKKKEWNWSLEYFFHHLFASDDKAKNLISELGLSQKLFYKKTKTSIYKSGKISQFDSPFSVLSFSPLTLPEKLRTGLVTLYLKSLSSPKQLENVTASEWLQKNYGKTSYEVLWKPLLLAKFGSQSEKIAMSWFWARVKKRSETLGYMEGGVQILIDGLANKIKENGGKIISNHEVKDLKKLCLDFEKVIFTGPTSVFLETAPNLPANYKKRLKKLKMIGALNLVLVLKEKFLADGTYWLNINEEDFPFVAVVEQTNFVDSKYYGGHHLLYVGGYYPQNHRYFKMTKEKILDEFLPHLQKINPYFDFQLDARRYTLYANLCAQPVVTSDYKKIIPPHQTPLKNVFLANMQQVYPWDRGINQAIEQGEKIAHEIQKS